MMAPSKTTSTQFMEPIHQTMPVWLMTDMVWDYIDYATAVEELDEELSDHDAEIGRDDRPGSSSIPLFIHRSVNDLCSTSASFLVRPTPTPIKSSSKPLLFQCYNISPKKLASRYSTILKTWVHTKHESNLQDALIKSEARGLVWKEIIIGMQARIILSNMYTTCVNKQL